MSEIIDCEEFGEVSIRLASLMKDGELVIDQRIAKRGYLTTAFRGGQVVFRATKFAGMIPLTQDIAIRVRPRANISHLSYMLARSQKAPTAISGFARGYSSKFVRTKDVERLFGQSLVSDAKNLVRFGLIKRYVPPQAKSPWRGRLLATETVRKHVSRGIRFRHEFDQKILSVSALDNIALKQALRAVLTWHRQNDRSASIVKESAEVLSHFMTVRDWDGSTRDLAYDLRRLLAGRVKLRPDYVDALWSAYAILDGAIPDLGGGGKLNFDSLIVNVSEVFEAYLRRELGGRLGKKGFKVQDGWKRPRQFFSDSRRYSVHPDMIVRRDDHVAAIIDAKYKPDVSEQDRYEVISFMDVFQTNVGAFVCPAHAREPSRMMGVTSSGKRLHNLRFDLGAADPFAEADRFADNVERMIEGRQDFR